MEVGWDRGRVGEKHPKELEEVVMEGPGTVSRTTAWLSKGSKF